MKTLKFVVRLLLSLAVSALFVWLSLRNAPVREVAHAIAEADKRPILGYFCIALVIHVVRTLRWGELLAPLGRIPFKRLNSASAVGIMMLIVLPLRLGEFARPLLVARSGPGVEGPRLRRSGAFASIVVERIADGLFVGVLGIIALHVLGGRATGHIADMSRHASWLVTGGFGVGLVALVLAFFLREQAVALTGNLLTPISPRLAGKASSMLDAFIAGLHLGSGLRVLGFFLTTALYWGLAATGLAVAGRAFGLELGPVEACTVLAVQVVGVMVPAGPGMVGTFQFATQVGLAIFLPGVMDKGTLNSVHAAAYANTVWLVQFVQQVGLGLIFMASGHVSLKGLFSSEEPAEGGDAEGAATAPLESQGSTPAR